MPESETIFNPKDNSLEARISAYRSVVDAWYNAEASMKHMDDDEWSYTLGEKQEVVKAHKITLDSLNSATHQISMDEMIKAKELGLLSDGEVKEFIQDKRMQEMKKIRGNRQKTNKSKNRER